MSKITLEQLQTELDNGLTNKKIAEKYEMNIRSVERRRAQIGALSGHVHHNQWQQFKEHPGATVESVGIIPPKDAYAHGGGYGAGRGVQGLIFDKVNGYLSQRICEIVRPTD